MTRFVYVLPAGRFRWEVRINWWQQVEPGSVIPAGQPYRVVPSGDAPISEFPKGHPVEWNASRTGYPETFIEAPISIFYTRKSRAMDAARAIAIIIGGEVQPHDRRGRIQDPDSYGGDSPRRRG